MMMFHGGYSWIPYLLPMVMVNGWKSLIWHHGNLATVYLCNNTAVWAYVLTSLNPANASSWGQHKKRTGPKVRQNEETRYVDNHCENLLSNQRLENDTKLWTSCSPIATGNWSPLKSTLGSTHRTAASGDGGSINASDSLAPTEIPSSRDG